MSKFSLKKHLQSLTKEQIVEVVLDAYNNSKAVQEYFDFYLQPNEKEKIKKYKAIIEKEFEPFRNLHHSNPLPKRWQM